MTDSPTKARIHAKKNNFSTVFKFRDQGIKWKDMMSFPKYPL